MSIEDGKQSKTELRDFDRSLKELQPDIYRTVITNGIKERKETAMAIGILRCLGLRCYGLLHRLICVNGT